MNTAENTTSVHHDNLEAVDKGSLGDIAAGTKAGGDIGLLSADAMTQAIRRVGPWPLIDHVEEFLRARAEGALATPRLKWAFDSIGWIRSGEMDIRNRNEHLAELLRVAYQRELELRRESTELYAKHPELQATWLERCVLHLGDLAVWAGWVARGDVPRVEDVLAEATNDAGLEIATELAQACGSVAAWEFVRSVRSLGGRLAS